MAPRPGLRMHLLWAVVLLSVGCSPPPVVVTTPDAATLESLLGKKVTLEGQVELHKAGYVLKTSGPAIVLECDGAQGEVWSRVGTRVQLTGTLRATEAPPPYLGARQAYPFHLEHPRCTRQYAPVQSGPPEEDRPLPP